jgi:hypothetical protein
MAIVSIVSSSTKLTALLDHLSCAETISILVVGLVRAPLPKSNLPLLPSLMRTRTQYQFSSSSSLYFVASYSSAYLVSFASCQRIYATKDPKLVKYTPLVFFWCASSNVFSILVGYPPRITFKDAR